jgi:propionyl-CoA carboxylase alpha chain/3-methylcrotonyl-CoA carboxylase alpha subunit/acetyl-CoA/propionyl-CoA carboxylase biotin carboxyl carrier protein
MPFTTVLVANRGEIACRIIRTLKAQGIRSVAVYHHEDRNAPHVALADRAVELTGMVPVQAYLDAEQIIAIAKATGAQGLHPGYGFLSENAGFAEAVAAAGIAFIGPDAEVIRLMGDKIRSRRFAAEHGVPIAPSVILGDDLDAAMKIVRSEADLADSISTATAEAKRYFGDGRVYAERLIERPRHIEVQVLGDGEGRVLHLYDRECSLQRRYQKIVEEAPAPGLPEALRTEICAAAVRLATAARYRNAGTVEFILTPQGEFYFLEMNTRLQVEHPVTELILGLDLVALQLRVAGGEGLGLTQDDLKPRGHAIECRICAEEPGRDFRPATGRIGVLRLPAGEGVRFDGGIREGQAVTPAFDSMLAKLVAYGATREEAAARLAAALDQMVLLGVPTNADYLGRILRHGDFLAGHLHTGFLGDHAADLAAPEPDAATTAAVLAAAALAQPDFRNVAYGVPALHAAIGHWRN